jgi:hypothetical protein
MSERSLMILIAGPYRSGTGDDPERMANNLRRLESVALPLYRAGHIPLIGEWIALPLLREAGSVRPGDAVYEEILYPIAHRLLSRCDAVLRLPGASKGADEDVRVARDLRFCGPFLEMLAYTLGDLSCELSNRMIGRDEYRDRRRPL